MGAAGILMRRLRGRLLALLSVVIAGVFIPAVLVVVDVDCLLAFC